jgi:hypothetical protein
MDNVQIVIVIFLFSQWMMASGHIFTWKKKSNRTNKMDPIDQNSVNMQKSLNYTFATKWADTETWAEKRKKRSTEPNT